MKLGVSHRTEAHLTDSHLQYLRQMGVEQIEVRISRSRADLDRLRSIKKRVESSGLQLFEIMLYDLYNSPAVALDLPEKKEDIAEFIRFIENLGRAGIGNTTYAFCTGGLNRPRQSTVRECSTKEVRLEEVLAEPAAYGREYTEPELWHGYERFIEEVLPAAERAGVRLQLHPNDPPIAVYQGVARIFNSTEAFRKALKIADYNPYSAILFCVGTWAEMPGPDGNGEDIGAALSEFVRAGHVHQIHFRNVNSPIPNFKETFLEDGYVDMHQLMRVLDESGYAGMIVPDHVPQTGTSDAGPYGTEAYLLGYMRSMINEANR